MVKFARVKGNDPISTKDGTATPAFIRFWDQFCRGLESLFTQQAATDARQDAADVAINNIILTIVGILNGSVSFSELNVASTQYRAFLQRTDGAKLTDSAGLATGVVPTGAVALSAITNQVTAITASQVSFAGAATTLNTVQNATITPTGGNVVIDCVYYLRALVGGGSFTMTTEIERLTGATTTTIYSQAVASAPLTGADQIVGMQTVKWVDYPAVGAPVAYFVRIKFDVPGWSTLYVSQRFLSLQEFKR